MKLGPLERRLLDTLKEGGMRKHAILKAVAAHWGYSGLDFEQALARLRTHDLVRIQRRQGGVHYEASA